MRIGLVGVDDGLFDVLVDGRFGRAHESGSHVYAFGAEGEGGGKTVAVSETAGGDEGDGEGLAGSGEEDEVGDVGFADVAGTFEAVDREEVNAEFDGGLRVADRRAFVEDDDVGGFEHFDDRARGVAGCFHSTDAFFDADFGVRGVVGWSYGGEERDVDTEGLLG